MIREQFDNDGFVILRGVFDDALLEPVRNLTNEIINYAQRELEDPFKPWYMRHRADQGVLYDLYQRHPEFRALAESQAILDAVEQAVGENILLYVNSLIYKPRGKQNGVPWHQDFISRPHEPTKFITWIPLDDADRENGCLKVIPGSHRSGFYPFTRVQGETHHDRIDSKYIDEDKIVHVEMEAGDVLIFNQMLLHASDKVDSPRPRRAFRIAYAGMNEVISPRGGPIVLRGGRPDFLARQFDTPYAPKPTIEVQPNITKRMLRKISAKLIGKS